MAHQSTISSVEATAESSCLWLKLPKIWIFIWLETWVDVFTKGYVSLSAWRRRSIEGGGTAPGINLSTICRQISGSHCGGCTPRERALYFHFIWGLMGPRNRSGCGDEEKNPVCWRKLTPGCPSHSQVLSTLTELPTFLYAFYSVDTIHINMACKIFHIKMNLMYFATGNNEIKYCNGFAQSVSRQRLGKHVPTCNSGRYVSVNIYYSLLLGNSQRANELAC
jgi:hypothetical protein